VQARFIDLGTLSPDALHAAYCGLAAAQGESAAPILLWARSTAPHMCIGQSQAARAELDVEACARAGIAIVRRPLGGGTVLVDGDQRCVFFILPQTLAAARPARVFEYCLAPLAQTFQRFGIASRIVGRSDLWCGDVKIAGSGAATLGHCMVLGSSFVMQFPYALFADLVRAPSVEFRAWLRQALPAAFSPWARFAPIPPDVVLAQALRDSVGAALGWSLRVSPPSDHERRAMRAAEDELRLDLSAEEADARRRVANGIKLNAATYLAELQDGQSWLRVLLKHRVIARIAAHDPDATVALQACLGGPTEPDMLRSCLEREFVPEQARVWAGRITRTVEGTPGDDDRDEDHDRWQNRL